MKRFINLSLAFLLITSSCKKNKGLESNPENIIDVLSTSNPDEEGTYPIDSYVILKSSRLQNFVDTAASYNIELIGKIIEDTISQRRLSIGAISLDGRSPINQDNSGTYHYSFTENDPDGGRGLFGKEVSFEASGSSDVEAHRRVMYVPNQLFVDDYLNYGMRSHISRSQNYPINWYADPNNPFGKVLIQVTYHPLLSRIDFLGAPASMPVHKYEVPDNGSFQIPASHLTNYPLGSVISVSLSRANYFDYYSNNTRRTKIVYITVVEHRTTPLYVTP